MRSLTITKDSFEERPTGSLFLGDLELGKEVVLQDRDAKEHTNDHGLHVVELWAGDDDLAEWGAGVTVEEAWRFALGAAIGPYDYDEPSYTLTWEPNQPVTADPPDNHN